ncbi:MAG: exodeoxyribonuclease V subunit gamma [Ferruginibacter sp.]
MALSLHASNDLGNLSGLLIRQLREETSARGVFFAPILVTQTAGIHQWLRIQMAEQHGIAANIRQMGPNELIGFLYSVAGIGQKKLLQRSQVEWLIYKILGDDSPGGFQQQHPFIQHYYDNNDVKRFSLSVKMADLFDQYQIYRTDIIHAWKKPADQSNDPDNWQRTLWRAVCELAGDEFADKSLLIHDLLEAIRKPEVAEIIKKQMPAIHFFGMAVITPSYLRIFHALSTCIDIHFYLINPAPEEYWMGTETEKAIYRKRATAGEKNKQNVPDHFDEGNTLLLEWGNIIKESYSMLFSHEEYLNVYDDSCAVRPQAPQTLLQKIQYDVYANAPSAKRQAIQLTDLQDGSVTINAAFSPSREVEMLYNHLIGLLDVQQATFSPKDVVVLVSNVDRYAPFIHAVFENPPYKIPFTIADESLTTGNTLFSAIQLIFQLEEEQLTAESMLELLEHPYICNRFHITNLPLIREAVRQSSIRRGLAGDDSNDTRLVSWQYGLKRMMYGLCMGGEPAYDDGTDMFYPVDIAEGSDAAVLIRFWYFCEQIFAYLQNRQPVRSINDWVQFTRDTVHDLVFESGRSDDEDYPLFIRRLEQMENIPGIDQEPVAFDIFRIGFIEPLRAETRAHSFLRGGVTFCSYIPMRSIPFKVVCMLGLNMSEFPRKDTPLGFSLFNKPQPGDRNVRENDKHLFLETILSAQDYLYLSYVGRSIQDGSEKPPSTLLETLIQYIVDKTNADPDVVKKQLVNVHPLHGFSQKYCKEPPFINYLDDNRFAAELSKSDKPGDKQPMEIQVSDISLDLFASFFKDPVKHYFRYTLRVYYRDDSVLIDDYERFAIEEKYIQYAYKNELLDLPDADLESYIRKKQLLGLIPLSNGGAQLIRDMHKDVAPLKELIQIEIAGQSAVAPLIDLTVQEKKLIGKLNQVYGEKYIDHTFSTGFYSSFTASYIKYITARAAGLDLDFVYFFKSKKGWESFRLDRNEVPVPVAREWLETMIDYYCQGQQSLFHFCCRLEDMSTILKKGVDQLDKQIIQFKSDEGNIKYYRHLQVADRDGYFDPVHYPDFMEHTTFIYQFYKK